MVRKEGRMEGMSEGLWIGRVLSGVGLIVWLLLEGKKEGNVD